MNTPIETGQRLTKAESQLWIANRLRDDCPCYNIPFSLDLNFDLNVDAFEAAFDEVIRRHPALRSKVSIVDGAPCWSVDPVQPAPLHHHDLSREAAEEAARRYDDLRTSVAEHIFDLDEGPIYRAELVRLAADQYRFLLCVHHVGFDARSKEIVLEDLSDLYEAFATGSGPAEQTGPDGEHYDRLPIPTPIAGYWVEKLARAAPLIQLPVAVTRPALSEYRGIYNNTTIPAGPIRTLFDAQKTKGYTPFLVLKTLSDLLFYRFGVTDCIMGTPLSARDDLSKDREVGYRVRVSVLRATMESGQTFNDLLAANRGDLLDCFDQPPFDPETILREANYPQNASFDPVFQVLFTHVESEPRYRFGPVDVQSPFLEPGFTKTDLEFAFVHVGDDLVFRTHRRADLFEDHVIHSLHREMSGLVETVSQKPDATIAEIMAALEDRSDQGSAAGNPPQPVTVIDQFLTRAEEAPSAPAVISTTGETSYADLRSTAADIASRLAHLQLAEGSPIGICMRRGVDLVAAQLAVLSHGHVVVPLDFTRRAADQRRIVREAGVACILLSGEDFLGLFDTMDIPIITLSPNMVSGGELGLVPRARAEMPALMTRDDVTGQVSVTTHGMLSSSVQGIWRAMDTESATTSLSTDTWEELAVYQVLLPLTRGDSVLIDEGVRTSALASGKGLRAHWWGTPNDVRRWLDRPDWSALVNSLQIVSPKPVGQLLKGKLETAGVKIGDSWRLSGVGLGPIFKAAATPEDAVVHRFRPASPVMIEGPDGTPVAPGGWGRVEVVVMAKDLHAPARTNLFGRIAGDGSLEVTGHVADRWNDRGGAIDLAFIEAKVERHPDVVEAAMIVPDRDRPEQSLLAVEIIVGSALNEADVRRRLLRPVPDYQRPARIVLTTSSLRRRDGSIDMDRLLEGVEAVIKPDAPAASGLGGTEAAVAALWTEVLQHPFDHATNFFDAGGDSLKLSRLSQHLNQHFNTKVRLVELFRYPTVRAMSELIDQRTPGADRSSGSQPTANNSPEAPLKATTSLPD